MDGLYYMDRNENVHVFVQLKKDKKDYKATINFQSGWTHAEYWTEEEVKELLESNIIHKADKMSWEVSFEKPKIKKGKKK
jgi:hypothetical protein